VNAVLFIVGFSAVFVASGASVTLLGQTLGQYRAKTTKVGGVLIVLFGLSIMGVLKLRPFLRELRHLVDDPVALALTLRRKNHGGAA
jgi:cytochrome c-type biogenesis protein